MSLLYIIVDGREEAIGGSGGRGSSPNSGVSGRPVGAIG
jgi:hypothetical protein